MKAILFCFILVSNAYAQETNPIVVILDGSGSMWQKMDGEFKIEIARSELEDFISKSGKEQQIGLVVYGHRNRTDCSDIETVLNFDNRDKEAFKKAIKEINPVGKTPLAKSAAHVLENLKREKRKATVILITDGLETCDGNLCQIVRDAKKDGIEFVLHIVGFGLGNDDKSSLECAALEGGGMYIDAGDAEQLEQAMVQSSKLPVGIEPATLFVKCVSNGELVDATVRIFQMGEQKEFLFGRTYKNKESNPLQIRAPQGTFDIRAEKINAKGVSTMELKAVKIHEDKNEILIDFPSGFLSTTILANGEAHDAGISVLSSMDQKTVSFSRSYKGGQSNPAIMEISPGRYNVLLNSISIHGYGQEKLIENVEIVAGQTKKISHDFDFGTLSIGTRANGSLVDATVSVYTQAPRRSAVSGRTYTTSNSNPCKFILSPGIYVVEIKALWVPGNPTERITVDLSKGQEYLKIIEW